MMIQWHCPLEHNSFKSDRYDLDEPPECAACGRPMNNDNCGRGDIYVSDMSDITIVKTAHTDFQSRN